MPLQKSIFEAPSLLDSTKEKRTTAPKKKLTKNETNYLLKIMAKKLTDNEDEFEELEEEIKPKKPRNYSPEARQKMEERLSKLREKSLMTRKTKAEEKKKLKETATPTPTPAPTPITAPTPAPVQDSKTLDDLKKAMYLLNLQGQKIKELNGKLNETTLKETIKEAPKEQVKEQVKVPVKQPTPSIIPGQEWWRNAY